MDLLIWIGAGISCLGLIGILWSAYQVNAARRAELSEEDLKARVSRMLPVNMGSLMVAVLGLMCVIVGISLG